MTSQLLLCKRLFLEGCKFVHPSDPVACGIAVSLFQDSAEMLVWALIKKFDLHPKDKDGFIANLTALKDKGIALSGTAPMHDLNKARVGFKHNGNLPAPEDAAKFQNSTEVFLRMAMAMHFEADLEDLSLVDLVPFLEVREHLKKAEILVRQEAYHDAVKETSTANGIMLVMLESYLPEIDSALSSNDRNIEDALGSDRVLSGRGYRGNVTGFRYVSDYLSRLRDVSLASLLQLPFNDYFFLSSSLRRARQTMGGEWVYSAPQKSTEPTAAICTRQIQCLVNMSIRLNDVLKFDVAA